MWMKDVSEDKESQPVTHWMSKWSEIADEARKDGFYLIYLEPGEAAVATMNPIPRVVAVRPKPKQSNV